LSSDGQEGEMTTTFVAGHKLPQKQKPTPPQFSRLYSVEVSVSRSDLGKIMFLLGFPVDKSGSYAGLSSLKSGSELVLLLRISD